MERSSAVNTSPETTFIRHEDIAQGDADNGINTETTNGSVWRFGAFEFTSDALRFVLIYVALMLMLAVGLYNVTMQDDLSVKAMWAPIVTAAFFYMVPAPNIPTSNPPYLFDLGMLNRQ